MKNIELDDDKKHTRVLTDVHTYGAHGVDDGGGAFGLLAVVESGLLADQRPQLVQVDGGTVGRVPLQVVVSHSHLTEVARVAVDRGVKTG